MKKKKLMLLGGIRYLIPIIEIAHEMGLYVITCDYLPDNIAHKYSDEYVNVSIIDKDAVLKKARELNIDGIMSFACDPGVVTAAYVAEKMNIPFQGSYNSVSILQDKGKFRKFLTDNKFNVPYSKSYNNIEDPFKELELFKWPVIVKPTDSAGSKGVTRVDKVDDLREAIDIALDNSHCSGFIIEEFITYEGFHSSSDVFTVNGKLEFVTYADQLYNKNAENPYTPIITIWPTTMKKEYQDSLTNELQRLMNLLDMKDGIYNVDSCVGKGGIPYIMEVSPRGGGSKLAEIQEMAYNVSLLKNEISSAVGLPISDFNPSEIDGVWCALVIHANPGQTGKFKRIVINDEIMKKYVKLVDCSLKEGDEVLPLTGANMALGDMFLRFDSREELEEVMAKQNDWLKIELEKYHETINGKY